MVIDSDLGRAILRFADQEGVNPTSVDGFTLYRSATAMPRMPVVYEPSICVVAQGRKRIYVGEQAQGYDPDNYLINSLTMPIEAEVLDASAQHPYLGLSLTIDRNLVSQLLLEMDAQHGRAEHARSADIVSASALTERLLLSLIRLLDTLTDPMDRQILAPSLKREVFYEVLKGPHGHLLRNCVANHGGANRIAPVVHFIEQNYQRPLDIDTLARIAGMSPSSLHEHFKQVTSMPPMQFVKSLRLHRARAMLMSGNQAGEASYRVGYSSPSQFSREFKRFFGDSPSQVLATSVS
ncbi:AraC family transcriptional regulator [Marinobacterium arenosum]|uniref:AraC family transcriptional regulator n=1 Tax=Marinobacterium arenosum TaxID=2862496 RepID=UPI001C983CB0|nr:AraC family transcriptional regulator [Marinobacterium arenosum]MBY4675035.1 AraC family transcriptional regulator [Marinobacterium arenosum]